MSNAHVEDGDPFLKEPCDEGNGGVGGRKNKKKKGTLKTQEKKEAWEKQVKRKREVENVVPVGTPENGFGARGASREREQDRGKERLKKRTYSKKKKQRFIAHTRRPAMRRFGENLLGKQN
ncbi:fibrosin-1-like protein [Arapaima gigas]